MLDSPNKSSRSVPDKGGGESSTGDGGSIGGTRLIGAGVGTICSSPPEYGGDMGSPSSLNDWSDESESFSDSSVGNSSSSLLDDSGGTESPP